LASLVDRIEKYIQQLLEDSRDNSVELQRNQLANFFACVPSQINYVLQTRFSFEKGYYVESRRGGGGYIRVTKLEVPPDQSLIQAIHEGLPEKIKQSAAEDLIYRLKVEEIITSREATLMMAVIERRTLAKDNSLNEYLRANLLRAMLIAIIRS
jgi:transcriptional regulator CtsR